MNPRAITRQIHVGGQRAFTSLEVAALSGLSYRQLDYSIRLGRVRPSIDESIGSGHPRLFSVRDVVKARLIRMTTPTWGLPPVWQQDLLAALDVVAVGDLAGQFLVIAGGIPQFMTFERLAAELPLLRSLVRVILCDELLRDLGGTA